MVIGVFGLPGMGKTSFLTKCAQKCLRGKSFMGLPVHKHVFTNFECRGCYKLDFDKLGLYQFEDALILIDEIMLLADARNFKTFPEHLKYFFSHHRHYNTTVLFCSQYWTDCDKRIRGVTDRYYLITKSNFLPLTIIKPIIRDFGVNHGTIEDGYFLGAPLTWRFVWRPHWYKYFDSFTRRELRPLELEMWDFENSPAPDLLQPEDVPRESAPADLMTDELPTDSPAPDLLQPEDAPRESAPADLMTDELPTDSPAPDLLQPEDAPFFWA